MNPPPPIPHENGSVTPSTPAAATAASTAFPPLRSMSIAAWVASRSTVAAAPPVPIAVGSLTAAADVAPVVSAAAASAAVTRRDNSNRGTRRIAPPRRRGKPLGPTLQAQPEVSRPTARHLRRCAGPLPGALELEDADRVLARVDDPGGPGEADVGDTVLGLQAGHVVVLDLDSAGAQFRDLGTDVRHPPSGLRLLVRGADRALGHGQLGVTALEHEGVLVLGHDFEPDLVVVELTRRGHVRGQQHRVDRVVAKHGCLPSLVSGARRLDRALPSERRPYPRPVATGPAVHPPGALPTCRHLNGLVLGA